MMKRLPFLGRGWAARSRMFFADALGLAVALVLVAGPALAAEPYAEFLNGLRAKGYGEEALDYLDKIATREDVPIELRQALDLERSKALRIAAGEAYDKAQRDSRLAEAKRLADKFFAENPSHPAAGGAILGEANEVFIQGQYQLAVSRGAKDKAVRDKALADAKAALTTARTQFTTAAKQLQERLAGLPPDPEKPAGRATTKPTARDELAFTLLEARFNTALAGYFLSQTLADPKGKEAQDLIKESATTFDSIYQEYTNTRAGYMAKTWYGKMIEEQGDDSLAMEIYDEVLVVAPDEPAEADPDLAPLFGQAYLFRMNLLMKTAELKNVIVEGEEWMKDYKRWGATEAFQGMALSTVKAKLQLAEKLNSAAEKSKVTREAITVLAAIGKVESSYRHEALMLRTELMGAAGTSAKLSVAEQITLARESAQEGNFPAAEKLYREAIAQATQLKDAKQLETAKSELGPVLYEVAVAHYRKNEMDQVLALNGEIVGMNPKADIAEKASEMAVAAALDKFQSAQQDAAADAEAKAATLTRLEKIAEFAIANWSDKPVGDDARMALAQASLIAGKHEQALEKLATVTSESKRYPTALQILGQVRWKQYVDGKKAGADPEGLQKQRAEAVTALQTSVERQKLDWRAPDKMPTALFDTQLLLADTYLEGQQPKEAAPLFDPLFQELKANPPAAIDIKTQRVYVGTVRALLGAGDAAKAGEAALAMAKLAPDAAQPNAILVDLAKLMGMELRKLAAEQEGADAGAAAPATTTASPQITALQAEQGKFLEAIASRKAFTIPQLIYLGDALVQLGKNQEAREAYQRLLDTIDKDESAKATAGPSVTRIRSRMVGLLTSEGNLDEAQKQVDALIQAHPNALEPLMEKGKILESRALRTPALYDDCVAHWTKLRVQLQQSKPLLPEYFEVLYNTASCLVRHARIVKDREKALQAEKILNSTLTRHPELSGPDMVAKFKSMAKTAATLRGTLPATKPPATKPAAAAPGAKTTPAAKTTPKAATPKMAKPKTTTTSTKKK